MTGDPDTIFLDNCLLFTTMLRQAGVPIGVDQVLRFVQALEWIDLGSREQFYYTARCLLICRYEHLRLFDDLFNRFWRSLPEGVRQGRQKMPPAPRHRKTAQPFTIVSLMAARAAADAPQIDVVDKTGTFSATELLQRKNFAELSPEELDAIRQLLERMEWRIS